ncbi:MAG TPA: hypothetical protein VGP73_26165 [Thermoanaerobaculia bacterium]
MDQKEREEKVALVKEQISQLENVDLDSLSDEDLESVAGGCSVWCCSSTSQKTADATLDGGA